jgi:hypothetical protein
MAFDYIRRQYKVPAKRGARVRFCGNMLGTVTSSYGPYIKVRFDGEKRIAVCHPTWEMEYLMPSSGKPDARA